MYDSKSTEMLPGVQANSHSGCRVQIAGPVSVLDANLTCQTSGMVTVPIVHGRRISCKVYSRINGEGNL